MSIIIPIPDRQRHINGIETRHIRMTQNVQHDDWHEESTELHDTSVLDIKSDGWTFKHGPDIISYMDGRGGFHPRRYIVPMTFQFAGAPETKTSNIIICEDGPRITLSMNLGSWKRTSADTVGSTSLLPRKVSPSGLMNAARTVCFMTLSDEMVAIPGEFQGRVTVHPTGLITVDLVGAPESIYVNLLPVTIVYDTGRY